MPIEERDEVAPELMRLRIISVAAENWGTYLGGESDEGLVLLPGVAGALEGSFDAIVGDCSVADYREVCAGEYRCLDNDQARLKRVLM